MQLDGDGLPRFEITHPVARDFMEWTEDWQYLAEKAMLYVLDRWHSGLR